MITIKLVSTKKFEKSFLRFFTNFTNFFREIAALGSKMAGQKPQLFDIVLHCLFVMPDYLPVEKRFDVQVSCGKNENFVKNFVKSGLKSWFHGNIVRVIIYELQLP